MDLDNCTSYQVSDSLEHRHHYAQSDKYVLRTNTDTGNGFGATGLKDSIRVLKEAGAPGAQGSVDKALVHLLRQLSSCEMKTRLMSYGLIDGLKNVASPPGKVSATVDRLVCQSFRQLAVMPPCLHALVEEGCVEVVTEILQKQSDASAIVSACTALQQMSETWDGRNLLLGIDLPDGLNSKDKKAGVDGEEDDADDAAAILGDDAVYKELNEARRKEERGKKVVATLGTIVDNPDTRLTLSALQTLANLTSVERGLQFALLEEVVRDVDAVLAKYAKAGADADWVFDESSANIIHSAVTVLWNIALDNFGKDRATGLPLVPYTLGKLLHAATQYPDKVIKVKAGIAGAISALYVRAQTKQTGLTNLYDPPQQEKGVDINVTYLVVKLLKQANALYRPVQLAKHAGGPDPNIPERDLQEIVSVIANSNQSIRLLSELPSARKFLRELLKDEGADLRRQLYYGTQFEAEFCKGMKN